MPADRRGSARGGRRHPGTGRRTGPGRVTTRSNVGRGRPTPPDGGAVPAQAGHPQARRRPRLTGRAAILVVVLAVLAVSYASSLRAYLQQRAHIGALKDQIAERRASIDELEREKQRWEDPEFVAQQARERFGYLMPGETSYIVIDANGDPVQTDEGPAGLTDPDAVGQEEQSTVYSDLWESVKLAGNPPAQDPPPLTEIGGADGSAGQ